MFGLTNKRSHERKASAPYILPFTSDRQLVGVRSLWSRWHTKRYIRVAFGAIVVLSLFLCFHGLTEVEYLPGDTAETHLLPPLYSEYHNQELRLPQHNPDLPYPEGSEGRYFWTPNHVRGSGWGNAMQELLLNSHLAYMAGLSYVFDNYTWNANGSDYTNYNGRLIPSRIPLKTLIQGPTAGGPFPPGDPAPRAVTKEYFDLVCPNPTIISSDEVTYSVDAEASAQTLMNKWIEKLTSMPDRCIEIDIHSGQLFPIWVFGSTRVLDIWPSYSKSPILTEFRWSPLIESAISANRRVFSPLMGLQSWLPKWFTHADDPYAPLPGLLALHIRRGDFAEHCMNLAEWGATWNGFNRFPELSDKFELRDEDRGKVEKVGPMYMRRCFPSIEQIVQRIEEVRQTRVAHGLRDVYIMTNGARAWVNDLKDALYATGHFKTVTSSRDLKLNWEQKYVSQSVDMLIGQRAQVLIGNGFSSLTSNIVMLRMANNIPPDSNRFW